MELQSVIANEHGMWAAAPYLRDRLRHFEIRADGDIGRETRVIRKTLDTVLRADGSQAEKTVQLRHVVDQAFFHAQLHDPAGCEIDNFHTWLKETDNMVAQVDYTVALIDHVEEDFVWSATPEVKQLRSLRKALLANLAMYRDLSSLSDSGNPEDQAAVAGVEGNIDLMLERAANLLRMYTGI